jgi:hypothetical protein
MIDKPTPPPNQVIHEGWKLPHWTRVAGLLIVISAISVGLALLLRGDNTIYDCHLEVKYVNGSVDTFSLKVMGDPRTHIYINEGEVEYWKPVDSWAVQARRITLTSYAKSFKVLP